MKFKIGGLIGSTYTLNKPSQTVEYKTRKATSSRGWKLQVTMAVKKPEADSQKPENLPFLE